MNQQIESETSPFLSSSTFSLSNKQYFLEKIKKSFPPASQQWHRLLLYFKDIANTTTNEMLLKTSGIARTLLKLSTDHHLCDALYTELSMLGEAI